MAGHSKFKNIMHRKGAQDKKRAKEFSKLGREITVAAKMGDLDPDKNPRLRLAVQAAKSKSMPKDNIERAIAKAASAAGGDDYTEIRYEGYGSNNIAVIVEALTDNKNRTASNVRTIFSKAGGGLGETGSVAFNFERIGYIEYPVATTDADTMFEEALEAGANDVQSNEETHEIETLPDDLGSATSALEAKFGTPSASRLDWKALNEIDLDKEKAEKLLNFIDTLEDDDDVQRVFTNANIPEEVMAELG